MSQLIKAFKNKFNNEDIRGIRSPLSISLIGVHSDHRDGRVTGMALDASIDFAYSQMKRA